MFDNIVNYVSVAALKEPGCNFVVFKELRRA